MPLFLLSGCSGFFFKPTSSGSTTSKNYVYVANAGSNTISGFQIDTAKLTATTSSPYTLSLSPTAITVTRSNTFLYVGTAAGIYGYTIGTAGQLTSLASGQVLQLVNVAAMETSPDGKWLITLNGDASSLSVFAIASDGTLSVTSSIAYAGLAGTPVPRQVRITPNASYIYAAVGTGGTLVYSFNTSTGAIASVATQDPLNLSSDNSIAIDSNSAYLYLARSGTNQGLTVYSINSAGGLTPVGSTYSTGAAPYSAAINGSYLYVANRSDSTISSFLIGSAGVLTAVSGSPFTAGSAVTDLAADSTGTYLLAASYLGSPDLAMYTTTGGALSSSATSSTGTNASFLAVTH